MTTLCTQQGRKVFRTWVSMTIFLVLVMVVGQMIL